MASNNKQPVKSRAPIADDVSHPPFEAKELRRELTSLLNTLVRDPKTEEQVRIGSYRYGVYAFYDYDGEPIYVGQTREKLSTRVRRHLTNQRTDAVAMSVLDPFEVCEVELYPLPELESLGENSRAVREVLDGVEAAVYKKALRESKFRAVLNEKIPSSQKGAKLPRALRKRIVSDGVMEVRSHPDARLARRAATLARLAQIISERKVNPGLRRVLVIQAKRLQSLAERRYKHFEGLADEDQESSEE